MHKLTTEDDGRIPHVILIQSDRKGQSDFIIINWNSIELLKILYG